MNVRFAVLAVLAALACRAPAPTAPMEPVAARRDHQVPSPHGERPDPYYWLRDDTRKDPDVLAYLDAENAYAAAQLAGTRADEDALFAEMKARIADVDQSAPYLDRGYWYYERFEAGKQHTILCRRKGTMQAPEEILLDRNQGAARHAFYLAAGARVSPDGRYLAYAEDTVGRNQFDLRIKDLTTGALLPDTVGNITPSLAWANDSKTVFYVGKDATTLRSRHVTRHVLGAPAGADVVVHDEADGAYYVSVARTKSGRYIAIGLSATLNSEYRFIDADHPTTAPQVFLARAGEHEYEVDHDGKRFVVLSNDAAKNFRLVDAGDALPTDRSKWRDVVPHDPDALISSYAVYGGFIAWEERRGGLRRVKVLPAGAAAFTVEADDAAFVMRLNDTPGLDTTAVRWTYESQTTPPMTLERDVRTGARTVIDETPVPTYDRRKYVSDYLHATAADGTRIPISVVRRKDTRLDGTAPLLIYGYGSYGSSTEPAFAQREVSLLDRGFVYAVAHIRGGSEMGRAWYEQGRQLAKMNTFTDFIAVTEHLVAQRYAARDKVFAVGGSAGGLLMGAIINLRPDLYRGVIATVPFVDVITTMLDATIPLTTNEYDEWGNPAQREVYDYMATYSPYDNVAARAYPSLMVITGLWDSQVQYFEPAKWVAKLRATRTDKNLLVFETNMKAGHGGKTGRFDRAGEWAHRYAFFLHLLRRPDARPGWPAK